MNKLFGITTRLMPCICSLSYIGQEQESFFDRVVILSCLLYLSFLNNTSLVIWVHLTVIGMYFLSILIPKLDQLFETALQIYISIILFETTLIFAPNIILSFIIAVLNYNCLELCIDIAILIVPFIVVMVLASRKPSKKENSYIYCLASLAISWLLVKGNGFDYLISDDSITKLFIPFVSNFHSFILFLFGFIPTEKILSWFSSFGMLILEMLHDNHDLLALISRVGSSIRLILDSIDANMVFQSIAVGFVWYLFNYPFKLSYKSKDTFKVLGRLLVPTL